MPEDPDEVERLARFEERMKERKMKEDKEKEEQAEKDRQAYLKRTGRTEMKP
jgi:hypothetical protein